MQQRSMSKGIVLNDGIYVASKISNTATITKRSARCSAPRRQVGL